MSTEIQKPPAYLSREAKRLWKKLYEDYELDDSAAGVLLEAVACSYDEWKEAERMLRREGRVVKDRFGQKIAHPCVRVARDAKTSLISALRQLHLDLEPLRDSPGRPPGSTKPK